jgi:hypothetical protein
MAEMEKAREDAEMLYRDSGDMYKMVGVLMAFDKYCSASNWPKFRPQNTKVAP